MGHKISQVNDIHFKTYSELTQNLKQSNVESLQSAIFIDFSKSNNWTGEKTYGYPLHDCKVQQTPYEHVLQTLMPVLKDFDDDEIYPVYRFGCLDTKDRIVAPILYPQCNNEHFKGPEQVRAAYRQAVQFVQLSGPTTLAPAINKGIEISRAYKQQGVKQHVILIIITDGDITDEKRDCEAVCNASNYPISICCIGVGDGPFDKMDHFDNLKKGRKFDNFHFTDFTEFMKTMARCENPELELATDVFTEVGAQHEAMIKLGLL